MNETREDHMDEAKTAKMIARYVRGGGNAERGKEILDDITKKFHADNLDSALVYWGFIPPGR